MSKNTYELDYYDNSHIKSNPTNVMNLDYRLTDEEQQLLIIYKDYIERYIQEHRYFSLNDIVYSIRTDTPYKIRDIAHVIIDQLVANKILVIRWDQGYYYERIK